MYFVVLAKHMLMGRFVIYGIFFSKGQGYAHDSLSQKFYTYANLGPHQLSRTF